MKLNLLLYITLLALGLLLAQCRDKVKKDAGSVPENVNQEAVGGPSDVEVDSAELRKYITGFRERQELLPGIIRFYQQRGYKVTWSGAKGPGPLVATFVKRLERSAEEGLRPEYYRIKEIKTLAEAAREGDEDATGDLDILLTSEFSRYAAQLSRGITRHRREETGWLVATPPARYDSLLTVVMADAGGNDPFLRLEPQYPHYQSLKKLLASYRQFARKGGWPQVSAGKKLRMGDTSAQVVKLREILSMTGDFITPSANFFNPRVFDRYLDMAVKSFQTRHGLEPDGIVAGKTLAALNVPIQSRINQILVTLERWRLMPDRLADDYLFVNVPEFKLHVYENGKKAFEMRVIVGKQFNATPVFSDKLEYLVFSPYWNIPKSITIDEVLPAMERNPAFMARNNMEVVKGWDPKKVKIVPEWEVPWYNIENDNFDYWIRQRPGGENPLGQVKFVFPNSHNVYLHDTPFDNLFNSVKRSFSHGCVRVSDPVRLTKWILRDKPGWTGKAIHAAMNRGQEQYVRVAPLPVYIAYFTIWVDDEGEIQVRDDIYGMDDRMAAVLSGGG